MSIEIKEPDEIAEFVQGLPPHLRENFEKADQQMREFFGESPGVPALMRMWLACGTSSRIRKEFELAVFDIKKRSINPNAGEELDEDQI